MGPVGVWVRLWVWLPTSPERGRACIGTGTRGGGLRVTTIDGAAAFG